jgi:hypothetical protein
MRFTRMQLHGLRRLASELGYELCVHTVCQHILWRRLCDTFHKIGVTDLHLSHAEVAGDSSAGHLELRVHSWPLIAPNVEVAGRRVGLEVGRPIEKKRYLASFVGAYMPHYRSDVRLRLSEAARQCGRSDVLVDLGGEWHFDRIVYEEQVKHKALDPTHAYAQALAVQHYNELLSDSVFSLCPEGAGPNTLRLWESLAVGSIPVIFAPGWQPPGTPEGVPGIESCALFVNDTPTSSLFDRLAAIPRSDLEHMQRRCIRLYDHVRNRTAFGA